MFHRYRELGPGSLPRVIRSTGGAALVASLTTAAGFGSVMIAQHQGIASLGLLAIVGIGTTFFTCTLFFACALRLLEVWGERREFSSTSI